MKCYKLCVFTALQFCFLGTNSYAFDYNRFAGNIEAQRCYGFAMVAMDSVINSRIGVPPEHALELARLNSVSSHIDATYSIDLLDNILNAYLWEDSPHSYAINVFYRCARNSGPMRSASTE